MPGITASFSVSEGWISAGNHERSLQDFRTEGTYSNGTHHTPATTEITLSSTSVQFGKSRMGGSFSFNNLKAPSINHNIKLELDLSDLEKYISKDSLITQAEGMLFAELKTSGSQSSLLNPGRKELLNNNYTLQMRFEDAGFRHPQSTLHFQELNGEMSFAEYLQIESLSGSVAGFFISLSGRGDNLKEYLFSEKGNLWLDLDVYSDNADLDTLFGGRRNTKTETDPDTMKFPQRIYLKSRFWFDEMALRDFSATNVMGDLFYQPGRLTFNNLTLSSMNGLIKGEGLLEQQSDNKILVKVISDISRVDIRKGFTSFHNFGQEFIMDRHLNGSLSGKVHFSAEFNKQMRIRKESILSECDIIIRNGELTGFEPMQKLSRFIEVEELENVSFSTLNNQIFIRNQEVLIPRMDIQSSAFEITGSGVHGFDKNFEYKVKVSLSELLSGKARKPDRQSEEFGAIEDDGLGRVYLYLIIDGSPGGTDIKYDRRGAIRNIRDQLVEEKTEIKQILNDEFGLFKKDSLLHGEDTQEKQGFIIEWEEDTESDSLKKDALKKDNKTDETVFTIRWEEEETDTMTVEKKKRKRLFKK